MATSAGVDDAASKYFCPLVVVTPRSAESKAWKGVAVVVVGEDPAPASDSTTLPLPSRQVHDVPLMSSASQARTSVIDVPLTVRASGRSLGPVLPGCKSNDGKTSPVVSVALPPAFVAVTVTVCDVEPSWVWVTVQEKVPAPTEHEVGPGTAVVDHVTVSGVFVVVPETISLVPLAGSGSALGTVMVMVGATTPDEPPALAEGLSPPADGWSDSRNTPGGLMAGLAEHSNATENTNQSLFTG